MKDKHKMLASHIHHIDNGAIIWQVVDKGIDEGIVLQQEVSYFGYPSISTEMRIDWNVGTE